MARNDWNLNQQLSYVVQTAERKQNIKRISLIAMLVVFITTNILLILPGISMSSIATRKYRSDTLSITAEYDEETANIPSEAELLVQELSKTSDAAYFAQREQAAGAVLGNPKATLGALLDIGFYENGEAIEPETPVTIKIELLSQDIPAGAHLGVVHFVGEQNEIIEQLDIDKKGKGTVVAKFDTLSLSEFGIVYTQDLDYEVYGQVYTLSLPGAQNLWLSDLLSDLDAAYDVQGGKEFAALADCIADVSSTDDDVISVTAEAGDWIIRILRDTEQPEKILITLQDGTELGIQVDANGVTELNADSVVISMVNDLYLPEKATAFAQVLDEADSEDAIAAVQELQTAEEEEDEKTSYQVFDIGLKNVNADAYDGFQVDVSLEKTVSGTDFRLFHLHDGETTDITDCLTLEATEDENGVQSVTGFSFVTDSFSEFVLCYTVDFHYDVDGQTYVFSIPGGSGIGMTDVVAKLDVLNGTSFDNAAEFVAEIESVTFSDPTLLWVGKAEQTATIGALKAQNDLKIEYSAELTEIQIYVMNAQTVEAGDWALISLRAFDTQESLTVTMQNGDVFTIQVTDESYPYTEFSGTLDGVTVVLYNPASQNVLQSTAHPTENNRLAAAAASVDAGNGTITPTDSSVELTEWTFTRVSGNTYYIHSDAGYLNIPQDRQLTVSSTPQPLVVDTRSGNPDQISITSADGYHVYNYSTANGYYARSGNNYITWLDVLDLTEPDPGPGPQPDDDVLRANVVKDVTSNNDGTYTIQLDVTGESLSNNINVMMVVDVTTSMNSGNKWLKARQAMQTLVETLTEGENAVNAGQIDFSLVTFGRDAQIIQTNGETWTKNNAAFKAMCNGISQATIEGTNWEAGLRAALEVMQSVPDNDPTYVIFLTDGAPNTWYLDVNSTNYDDVGTQPGVGNSSATSELHAEDEAQRLTANTILYGIYIFGGDELNTEPGSEYARYFVRLEDIVNHSGGVEAIAATAGSIEAEFTTIAEEALRTLGPNNVMVYDGITDLSVVKTNGNVVDFEYQISSDGGATWTSWQDAPPASYNEEDGVTWDLSSLGIVTENYQYRLRFVVWPSQEAYDLIADINNGVIRRPDGTTAKGTPDEAYNALSQDVKDQLEFSDGLYRLKTNTHLGIDYTYENTDHSDGGTTLHEGRMPLPPQEIRIKKEWINNIDGYVGSEVDVYLYKDGQPYLTGENTIKIIAVDAQDNQVLDPRFHPESIYGWRAKDEIHVSCGLISRYVDGQPETNSNAGNITYVVEETGRDYTLMEPEYHWDLSSNVYRPMVINGEKTVILILDDTAVPQSDSTGNFYVDGTGGRRYEGKDYYVIGEKVYKVTNSNENTITVTNIRRSNLNLTKAVQNALGNPITTDQLFEFNITVNDAWDEEVYFSVQVDPNDTSTVIKNLETDATPEYYGDEPSGYYYVDSGTAFTVFLKPGWNLRFTNLPIGSTYTITESSTEGYSFNKAEMDNDGNIVVNINTATVTGTIDQSNTQYTLTYTNQANTTQVNILKTNEVGTQALAGAVFKLEYRADSSAVWTNVSNAIVTELDSNSMFTVSTDGIELTGLMEGQYRLQEITPPAGYIITNAYPVQFTVANGSITDTSGTDGQVTYTQATASSPAQFAVPNTPGVELPHTGGMGTWLFYLTGSILVLGAGVLLLRRRRREAIGA